MSEVDDASVTDPVMPTTEDDAARKVIPARGYLDEVKPGRFSGQVEVIRYGRGAVELLKVHFCDGARTAEHRHDTEQWLYFLEEGGFVQLADGQGKAVGDPILPAAGSTVITPPGLWHHHGAVVGADSAHLSIMASVMKYDDNWHPGQFLDAVPGVTPGPIADE